MDACATVRQKLAQQWEVALTALRDQQEKLARFDSQDPRAPTNNNADSNRFNATFALSGTTPRQAWSSRN
jgi:hypothetical protein